MMRRKIIAVLSVIFALTLSVLCFASCSGGNATKAKYTVTFETDGGSTVEAQQVERGATATKPEDPTKDGYAFAGWYLGEEEYDFSTPVKKAITLNAKWSSAYVIIWKNYDGTVLLTSKAAEGTIPAYTGETPTKEATAQYTFAHSGWTPEIIAATENAEYTATYSETVRKYTVTWLNGEEELYHEDVDYGTTPEYTGETPTKAADAQ